jgi:hypothetical protein
MFTFASSTVATWDGAAGQLDNVNHESPAFFVALECQIEREIVARDDFVNKLIRAG